MSKYLKWSLIASAILALLVVAGAAFYIWALPAMGVDRPLPDFLEDKLPGASEPDPDPGAEPVTELTVIYRGKSISDGYFVDEFITATDPLELQVKAPGDITWSLTPVKDSGIVYVADGTECFFSDLQDLSAGFLVTLEGDELQVAPKDNLRRMLSAITGKNVTVLKGIDQEANNFVLTISDGNKSVSLSFALGFSDVSGVQLSESEVIF